ncbi:MAG: bifunctional folylpolyglutamate synthase/dihydrofolate synthase [Novosphingobium sp.]|nr:bifunctional folylpolyglutamate synthase/dihydrofolate synthase [Novosphingobium sp.]
MADFATSDSPAVQAQLDRLNSMTAGQDKLGRARLRRLLDRLGSPERHMPPAFHVAGTNGKGSVCTYLREAVAAAGMTAHVFTSPHLVRLNERIRIANRLVSDEELAQLLSDTLDAVGDDETTFFEATTAATFLAFSRHSADASLIEVGIGGRLDATNVIPSALACGIAQIGIDHQEFLGETIEEIASEKAGIAKPRTPLVTLAYPPAIEAPIAAAAASCEAPVLAQGKHWHSHISGEKLHYRDARGELELPLPPLAGAHQADNAGLAIAMLRHQDQLDIPPEAMAAGIRAARWPARLQTLGDGPLTVTLPDATFLLDGAHNADAARAIAAYLRDEVRKPVHAIVGMLASKDAESFLRILAPELGGITAIPITGYDFRSPFDLAMLAQEGGVKTVGTASSLDHAVSKIGKDGRPGDAFYGTVLITGSLYLAGQVLRLNREIPD